jgi:hypothetical protein
VTGKAWCVSMPDIPWCGAGRDTLSPIVLVAWQKPKNAATRRLPPVPSRKVFHLVFPYKEFLP